MICPNCGSNFEGAFCPNCGTAAQQPNAASNMGATPPVQPNMQQYTGAPVPPPTGSAYGVQERNIALCIIFSLITCGIYGLYWLYCLTEDVKKLSNNPNGTSGGITILLGIVTCGIYLWYWMYTQGDAIDKVKQSRGIASGNTGILYLILSIVGLGIVSYALMQNEINHLAK